MCLYYNMVYKDRVEGYDLSMCLVIRLITELPWLLLIVNLTETRIIWKMGL